MIPSSGTFDYVTTVPATVDGGPWPLRAPHRADGLVGPNPSLVIADAGLTPNPGWESGIWRPEVLRHRLTLRASGRKGATVARASLYVDRGITAALRAGDELHLTRTGCGFLGLSVLRGELLVVAVGAVTAVPLGSHVSARVPHDLVEAAATPFKLPDPHFEFPELPIEVTVEARRALLIGHRRCQLGGYEITMVHGHLPGTPGVNESVAIARTGLCSEMAAVSSAQLLAYDPIEMARW
jgi:hypothetical protein